MNRREIAEQILRCMTHPDGALGCMADDERSAGHEIVPHNATDPIPVPDADWMPGCISISGNEVRIIAVYARTPGNGAFKRLIGNIQRRGFRPVVVAPMGKAMPAIMRRWGWHQSFAKCRDDVTEEWRP